MRKLLLIAILFFSGCASYKNPICPPESRKDVANFEGRFSIHANDKDYRLGKNVVTVSRIATGTYLLQGQSVDHPDTVFTCEIDGQPFLEMKALASDPANTGDSYSAVQIRRQSDGSFDLIPLSVDTDVLKERRIPFHIFKPDNKPSAVKALRASSLGDTVTLMDFIFVDNSNVSQSDFSQLLDPVSFKMNLMPEGAHPYSKPAK
jgi:hypothetical protein